MAAEIKAVLGLIGKTAHRPSAIHFPSIHRPSAQDAQFATIYNDLEKRAVVREHENSECTRCATLSIQVKKALDGTKDYPRYLKERVHEAAIIIYNCAIQQNTDR